MCSLAASSFWYSTVWSVRALHSHGNCPSLCWHSRFKCFQTSPHFGKYGWKTINIVRCHNWFILHSGEQRCQNTLAAANVRVWTAEALNGFDLRAGWSRRGLLSPSASVSSFFFKMKHPTHRTWSEARSTRVFPSTSKSTAAVFIVWWFLQRTARGFYPF